MTTAEEEAAIYGSVEQIAYEGSSTSYRLSQRGLIEGDSDSLAARELLNLQMRSGHSCRNNGTSQAALLNYMTSLSNIVVNWKTASGDKHELAQELWEEFADNPNLDGYGTFKNTQAYWNGSIFVTGASYTRMVFRKTDNENRVGLKLQGIPSVMHDVLYNGKTLNDRIRHGIKFIDSKPRTYYFREGLNEQLWYGVPNTFKHTAIPAKDVIHIFDRESPGQWLGIPKLASVLLSLYELDDLRDATVAKQKAAQAIAWIIENTNPISMTPTGVATSVLDKDQKDTIVFKAQGGSTQYLNKGEKINFYQSTDIGPNLPVLINSELRKISSALGIPYHTLTGDTSGLDFSSLRAIAIELRKRLEFIHHFRSIPLGIAPVTKRFKELGSLRFSIADAIPTYQIPKWYGVDDLKDSQANLLNLSIGGTTLQKILDDAHITFEELQESKKMLDKVGLGHLMEGQADAGKQVTNTNPNANSSE